MAIFQAWFDGKRFYPFLLASNNNPLTFNQRLVHSFITYRTAKGGCSAREIARTTRLARYNTVVNALAELHKHQLIDRAEEGFIALEPPKPDWFVWRKKSQDKPWLHRLISFPMA